MSEIIRLGEHKWQLPNYPESQSDVLFYDQPQADQFWRRDLVVADIPQYFYDWMPDTRANADKTHWNENTGFLMTLSREDTATFIRIRDRELRRRIHGVWFMNNGIATYLTGDHYFQLVWGAMKGYINPDDGSKFGQYREFQAHHQYFQQHCRTSRDSFGRRNCSAELTVKPKKTGITQEVALNFLNRSTMRRERIYGMISKSLEDVKVANFAYYVFGLDNLPFVFRPPIENQTTTEVKYGNPRGRQSGSAKSQHQAAAAKGSFNTTVFAKGLAANAFDGPVMEEYWCDEWTKMMDPYPKEVFDKTKETVKLQEVIHGLGHWTAYVSETDGREFKEAKEIMQASLLSTMNDTTGRTNSEFFYYFISAEESGESGFDRYGKADRIANRQYIMAKRAQLESKPEDLQTYMRQYPLTTEEAWREGGGGNSIYNNVRIGKRKEELEAALRRGELPYQDGDLKWRDPLNGIGGLVDWVPLTTEEIEAGVIAPCRFYLRDKLPEEAFNRPILHKMFDDKGRLTPDPKSLFIGATDPTEFAQKSNVKQASKQASTVMILPNVKLNSMWDMVIGKRFCFVYKDRPEDPRDMVDFVMKKILYFGCFEALESNRQWMFTMLVQAGLGNFMLVWNKATRAMEPYDPAKHQAMLKTVTVGGINIVEDLIRAKKGYYVAPRDGEPDYLSLMEDERILEDDMGFKSDDTKKSDLSMCSSYNIMAMEAMSGILQAMEARSHRYDPAEMQYVFQRLLS